MTHQPPQLPTSEPTLKPEQVHEVFTRHFPRTRISKSWIGFAADMWELGVKAQPSSAFEAGRQEGLIQETGWHTDEVMKLNVKIGKLQAALSSQAPSRHYPVTRDTLRIAREAVEQEKGLSHRQGYKQGYQQGKADALQSRQPSAPVHKHWSAALADDLIASGDVVMPEGQPADESISVQEVWEAAGGNPGIKATKPELLDALRMLDEVCDEAGRPAAPVAPVAAVQEVPTDEQIVHAIEAAGVKFQRFMGGISGQRDCWSTSGSQAVHKIANGVRAMLVASPTPPVQPLLARHINEWHEDDGPVMWWAWNGERREWAGEPAWIGSPLSEDWPGYHTHWTPHPKMPALTAAQAEGGS